MVPADAKKRWCPFVRELGDNGASYNRNYAGQRVGGCLGPDCMAWRWHPYVETVEMSEVDAERLLDTSPPEHVTLNEHFLEGETRVLATPRPIGGFCGLAGAVGAA